MKRRDILVAASSMAAMPLIAATSAQSSTSSQAKRTYVLIHGAWHGGWCWQPVRERLEAAGHRVLAPSLTGLADRSHLMSASITLDTHIADIVNLFRWEELDEVVLVAHSYGGWPVSGALDQIADRVSAAVFVDAFVPTSGEAGRDLTSPNIRALLDEAMARGDASRPPPDAGVFRLGNPEHVGWVSRMMTPQPNGVAIDPLVLAGGRDALARKIYVRGTSYPQARFDSYVQAGRADPTWEVHELACGHHVMLDMPDELTEILLNA